MKRAYLFLICAAALFLSSYQAIAERVVFMPQWYPQAQFAGYYMALEKGFYAAEGLDVEIKHLNLSSKNSSMGNLLEGKIDITTAQLVNAMTLRSNGKKIVNILQTSQNSGLSVVTHKTLNQLQDLNGLSIGRWKSGFEEVVTMVAREYDLEIKWVPVSGGLNLFISKALDGTLAFTFNELVNLELATGVAHDKNIIHFADYGYNFPEDGLYVREEWLAKHRETAAKFAKASELGWKYARENPEETVEVVQKYMSECNARGNKIHQSKMLEEMLRLQIDTKVGKATFAPISREDFNELMHRCIKDGIFESEIEYDKFIRQ